MRDEDPKSLNVDFVRTFTISSSPTSSIGRETQFAITIRKVGPVTKHLFQQNERAGFEVPILGIGGDFKIVKNEHSITLSSQAASASRLFFPNSAISISRLAVSNSYGHSELQTSD
jgi:hypothetical protein